MQIKDLDELVSNLTAIDIALKQNIKKLDKLLIFHTCHK